jgi:hypothetical protein
MATKKKTASKKTPAKVEASEGATKIRPDVTDYVAGVSGSGKKTKNCGDTVAATLNGLSLDDVAEIAGHMLGQPAAEVAAKYSHLNVGQQRMNLGNRIRGVVAKLNKENDGSGDTALEKASVKYTKARDKAMADAEKAKAAEAKAKAKAA